MRFDDIVIAQSGSDFVGNAILAETGLRNILTSSYDFSGQTPQGVLTYSSDSLEFGGFGYIRSDTVDAFGTLAHSEITASVAADDPVRIDMLWRGTIRATIAYPRAVTGVEGIAPLSLDDIDGDIAAPLPTDPAALEAARRAALLARMRAAGSDPAAYDDDSVSWLLGAAQVASVAELVGRPGAAAHFSQLVLSITPLPGSQTAQERAFPVAAAILVRDVEREDVRLATLLQASRSVLERLRYAAFEVAPADDLPPARPVVVWVVAEDWFDDTGWPGTGSGAALRASRIATASRWLGAQGIALNPLTID